MKDTMNSAAIDACFRRAKGLFILLFLTLSGCALPNQAARPALYDFGPGSLTATPAEAEPRLPALALDLVEASPALDSTAVLYRLAYADKQQLRPYALARWSMTPAQLLRQRLRQHLSQRRALLSPGDISDGDTASPVLLRIELEEFSQLFEAPDQSTGLLRLRASLTQPGPKGEKWLAQRSLTVQRRAPTADAPGGVRALTVATDAALQELDQWLQALGR